MDQDRTTRGFQRWLDMLDEAEVQAQIDAVRDELEQLQRRRDLLVQAVALKHDWDALLTPDGHASQEADEDSHLAAVAEGERDGGFFGSAQSEDPFAGGQAFDAGAMR
jgi:hypothetical protein